MELQLVSIYHLKTIEGNEEYDPLDGQHNRVERNMPIRITC